MDATAKAIRVWMGKRLGRRSQHGFSLLQRELEVRFSLSDKVGKRVTISPPVPELWCRIMARKVFSEHYITVKLTSYLLDIKCLKHHHRCRGIKNTEGASDYRQHVGNTRLRIC